MAYQTLYRRYRSQRFSDLRGQDHVVRALRSAVRDERVGHAYLFSGPRGTGKTSTARILAKALNCDHLDEGDPCGTCESCRSIETGASFDLHELDAASNNGVEAIRDLISRTGIGSPGRTKVYILDEVHMLSAGASNALLKTLEDPPAHVVFVLATTDPHKVLPTIRSRTQHLEFGLIPADVLAEHVRWVIADAELDVSEDGVAYALRQGGGSARDTLSALEQVVSAGGVPTEGGSVEAVLEALCESDGGAAITAVAQATSVGREPRPLAEDLLAGLRDVFLAAVGGPLDHLTDEARGQVADRAHRMGRATIARSMELIGEAIAEMRHVGDPRIPLEVALVRLTAPELDSTVEALLERVNRLERLVESGGGAAPAAAPAPTPAAGAGAAGPERSAPPAPPPMPPRRREGAPAPTGSAAAPAAAAASEDPQPEADPASAPSPTPAPAAAAASSDGLPGLGELTTVWQSTVLGSLSNRARARYGAGRFVAADSAAEFALPNPIHRDRCEDLRDEVEAALQRHFGRPVPLRLVVDGSPVAPGPDRDPPPQRPVASSSPPAPAPSSSAPAAAHRSGRPAPNAEAPAASPSPEPDPGPSDDDVDIGDVSELDDADVTAPSTMERITELFPGAEVVEDQP